MIEYVLVTVKYSNKMTKDMELPAQAEIGKVCEMLLETLQTAEPMLFADVDKISLKHMLSDKEISKVLKMCKTPKDAAKTLVDRAKANGGRDNITAIVLDITKSKI